jgi:16S rRNA (guanine527-N7)-methyltransferase
MSQVLRTQLEQGVQALKLELAPAQIDLLMSFMDLLQKWNKVYNLTSVRDPQEMLTHHLLDSLAAVPALLRHVSSLPLEEGKRLPLLDVGSGGGLPGVVFAICCPQIDVNCVDTVGKKAAFIQQVAASLRLPNLRGIHDRVENLKTRYPVISCRAFASWWTSPPGRARRWPRTASGLP